MIPEATLIPGLLRRIRRNWSAVLLLVANLPIILLSALFPIVPGDSQMLTIVGMAILSAFHAYGRHTHNRWGHHDR